MPCWAWGKGKDSERGLLPPPPLRTEGHASKMQNRDTQKSPGVCSDAKFTRQERPLPQPSTTIPLPPVRVSTGCSCVPLARTRSSWIDLHIATDAGDLDLEVRRVGQRALLLALVRATQPLAARSVVVPAHLWRWRLKRPPRGSIRTSGSSAASGQPPIPPSENVYAAVYPLHCTATSLRRPIRLDARRVLRARCTATAMASWSLVRWLLGSWGAVRSLGSQAPLSKDPRVANVGGTGLRGGPVGRYPH